MSDTHPFHAWIRLEQPRLGSQVVHATDEFFAAKERLIDPADPVFIADKYDDHGKWMDGWESRRKRTPGNDHAILRLGIAGIIHGVDIDTSNFTGNYPPQASIDGCYSAEENPQDGWWPVLPKTDLAGDTRHLLPIEDARACTHLRLNIFPDGGVARLRVFGEVDPVALDEDGLIDLFALRHGGRALRVSDEHFGSMHNLNLPGRGVNMGDGWETARRRGPGNDWVIVALAQPGTIDRAEIDTAHFKGNFPDRASLEAGNFTSDADATNDAAGWQTLMPESKLKMDQQHYFEDLASTGPVTHVRMSIYPDGGVSRLRLFGKVGGDDS